MTTTRTDSELMTPREVADVFRVSPKTVTRWAKAGLIGTVKTLGGHRRFRRADVNDFLANLSTEPTTPTE